MTGTDGTESGSSRLRREAVRLHPPRDVEDGTPVMTNGGY